jgi:chromosome segregation ATPase
LIDWTQVLVAAVAGLLSGSAITAIWNGLKARAESKRSDAHAHIAAADAISETVADALDRTIQQYETRITRSDDRLAALEDKCQRYEMAFETMRLDLIQARQTIAQLETANGELRGRVKHLEDENAELKQRLEQMESASGDVSHHEGDASHHDA